VISQNFALIDEEREALIAAGVAGADGLATFRFFDKGIETNTKGVGVVATSRISPIYVAFSRKRAWMSPSYPGKPTPG
jgi:hypothetical protein